MKSTSQRRAARTLLALTLCLGTGVAVAGDYDQKLRRIVNPEVVDAQARADQRILLEKIGGREVVLKRGAWDHSPPPGKKAQSYELDT